MKQQTRWLLCVVCALGVSGVVLGGGDGSGGEGGSESVVRCRKSSSQNGDSQVQKSDDESEEEPSSDSEHTPFLAPEEGALPGDDDEDEDEDEYKGKSVLAARHRQRLVSMGERFFNALWTGYGSRVMAEGIFERASQIKDEGVRNRMYESAAEKYLEEAKACGADGKSEREEMALKHFIDAVERIGDRELQVQLYAIAAEGYLTEATRCEDAGNVEREMEARKNHASFLNRQAVCMPDIPENRKQKLKLYRQAADERDELAEQEQEREGRECKYERACAHYNAGVMEVQLARATDEAKEESEAAEESELLEKAKEDLELARQLFTEVNETEMVTKANKLLNEAKWLCSSDKRLEDGRSLCDQARRAATLVEQQKLLRKAREKFRDGIKLCTDQDTEVKIQLLKAIRQTYTAQDGIEVTPGCKFKHRQKVAKYCRNIAAEEKKRGNKVGHVKALAAQACALWLQSGCADAEEKEENLLLEAAQLSEQVLQEFLQNDSVLLSENDSVSWVLGEVIVSLDCYRNPLLALENRFAVAALIMEVLSRDEVRQCIIQTQLRELYDKLAYYFDGAARCERINDQVRQEAKKRVANCRAQITQIEEELRRIEEGLEGSEEDDDEIVVAEDTNSSKKEAAVPPSSSVTPPVVSVSK